MEEKIELQHLVCNCCGEDIGNDDYYEVTSKNPYEKEEKSDIIRK